MYPTFFMITLILPATQAFIKINNYNTNSGAQFYSITYEHSSLYLPDSRDAIQRSSTGWGKSRKRLIHHS